MKYSTARSKRAVVHEALATYVAVKAEERKRASYRERLDDVRRKTGRNSMRTRVLDILKSDRERSR